MKLCQHSVEISWRKYATTVEYHKALRATIAHSERRQDYRRFIELAVKYLAVDKFAEEIYQLLMVYYSQINNKVMVAKTFKQCKRFIAEELNCALSDETITMYRRLVA